MPLFASHSTLSRNANDTTSRSGSSVSRELTLLVASFAKVVDASVDDDGTLDGYQLVLSPVVLYWLAQSVYDKMTMERTRDIRPIRSQVRLT